MHLKHWILISMMVIIYSLAGLVGYWELIDGGLIGKVITIQNPLQVKTEKTIYHPGEMVQGYITFCKYRNVVATIKDALIDDYLKEFSPRDTTSGVIGCKQNLLVNFDLIPPDTFPEKYHITRTLEYNINPLKTVVIQLQTNSFEVQK